jgi:hypothetical protein
MTISRILDTFVKIINMLHLSFEKITSFVTGLADLWELLVPIEVRDNIRESLIKPVITILKRISRVFPLEKR